MARTHDTDAIQPFVDGRVTEVNSMAPELYPICADRRVHALRVWEIPGEQSRRTSSCSMFSAVDTRRADTLSRFGRFYQHPGVFGTLYCLLVWSVTLANTESDFRDQSIFIEVDNTAALSWLLKRRASTPSAECIVRLYSLATAQFRFQSVGFAHIAGGVTIPVQRVAHGRPPKGRDDVLALASGGRMPETLANLRHLATVNSLADASWGTYVSGFRSWLAFCSALSIHWAMHGLSVARVVDLVCNYVILECCIRKLCPELVCDTYVYGVVAVLRVNSIPAADVLSEALKSSTVKMVADGLRKLYAKVHPRSERLKVAFSPAAARHMETLLASNKIDNGCKHLPWALFVLATLRLFACAMFAISFLLRKSEMLYKEGKMLPHHPRVCTERGSGGV